MTRFGAETEAREGETLVALRDGVTGAVAHVWPGAGNVCLSALLPVLAAGEGAGAVGASTSGAAGEGTALVEAIFAPPSLAEMREQPSHWGVPLLFPFPSRMAGGRYTWEGQQRRFEREGHGFAMVLPWKVVSMEADDTSARVTSALDSVDHTNLRESYPFDYRVEATYTLDARGLALTFRVVNTGDAKLPFGYGAHPYLKLPLGPEGDRGTCLLHVPASKRWNGAALRDVSEGKVAPLDTLCEPISAEWDLRTPRAIVEKHYDGVWTDLSLVDGLVECSAQDPLNGRRAVMRATPNHPNVTVFTPPWGPSVCFEPWTCPPNAFNLAAHNVPGNGLTVLEAGEQWEGTMWLSVEEWSASS